MTAARLPICGDQATDLPARGMARACSAGAAQLASFPDMTPDAPTADLPMIVLERVTVEAPRIN
jgi:hypothetical protein